MGLLKYLKRKLVEIGVKDIVDDAVDAAKTAVEKAAEQAVGEVVGGGALADAQARVWEWWREQYGYYRGKIEGGATDILAQLDEIDAKFRAFCGR